ncbi:MAG: haloacid dehalogenase [Chloroflexi bacterium]|nr:haloacid dehalogenase [Chloroflexota bacterium]
MSKLTDNLEAIAGQIRQLFTERDVAREKVLPLSREVIRFSSNAIRAIHRHEFEPAQDFLQSARELVREIRDLVAGDAELGGAGFVRDAEKELAEASLTFALIAGNPLPSPEELGVAPAAYLNGLGEAVGELRRFLLDSLREGDLSRSEELLAAMDDIYNVLVTMDFPDAITGGLRRTTDVVRGVLEKTRSDLTLIARQKDLTDRLEKLERDL